MDYGKRRTREHVIADLSVNHVEKVALHAGFTAERATHDYGIDLLIKTYNSNGEIQPGYIYLQLKATDHLVRLQNGAISVTVDSRDLNLWLGEIHPVLLVIYDAQTDRAYWIFVQKYFQTAWRNAHPELSAFRTVRFPKRSRLTTRNLMKFSELNATMYRRK